MTPDVRLNSLQDQTSYAPATRRAREARIGRPHSSSPTTWERRYARLVLAGDLLSISVVVPAGLLLGYGTNDLNIGARVSPWLPLFSGLLTFVCLSLGRAWDARVLGHGSTEFTRLIKAIAGSSIVLGMTGLALEIPSVRPWAFGLIPIMGVLCLASRHGLRRWLAIQRRAGRMVHSALVVGSVEAVGDLIARTRREPLNGWVVRGACTPEGTGPDGAPHVAGVAVVGDLDSVAEVVRRGSYRVVAIGRASGWTPRRMHQLAWDIEGTGADMVVDPGLMEVAGPRLHVAPVDGLPLLRLTKPALDGVSRVVKAACDRVGAAVLLLAIAPLLVVISVAVMTDGGPIFFRQTRVGRDGQRFQMIKFRSMVPEAERLRAGLAAHNESDGPLFKIRHDPRITRTGNLIRKYSFDELPQLFNVLVGSMSLVGPRPPLPEEVATYGPDAARKLRVRPGLTGLWQVSGRSNLSWEESVRLDLRYVENWSLTLDAIILWKTIGAVARGNGAY